MTRLNKDGGQRGGAKGMERRSHDGAQRKEGRGGAMRRRRRGRRRRR